jgi:superfamily II DNA or RNA helicase
MKKRPIILKNKGWQAEPISDPILEYRVKRSLTFFRKEYRATYKVRMYGSTGFKLGLLDYLNSVMQDVEFELEKSLALPPLTEAEISDMSLWDYQVDAVNAVLSKGRGIISSVTGSGKTKIEMALMKRFPKPCLVLVPSRSLMSQMYRECTAHGLKCSVYGDGHKDTSGDIIIMINASYSGRKRKAQGEDDEDERGAKKTTPRSPELTALDKRVRSVIVDEVHHAKKKMYALLGRCKAEYRAGFSATPWAKTWQEYEKVRLIANFGDVVFNSKGDERVEKKVFKPEVYLVPYEAKNIGSREIHDLLVAIKKKDFITQKRLGLVQNKERNRLILKLAELCRIKGLHVFIVLAWTEQIDALQQVLAEDQITSHIHFLTGHTASAERDDAYALVEEEENVILCGTVGGEGVDLKGLNVVLLCDVGYAEIKLIQSIGRSTRKKEGKVHAFVIDIWDVLFSKHGKNRKKIYEEEGFEIKGQKDLFDLLSSL